VSSFYAIASRLAGPGIGTTAFHAAHGIWRAGLLDRLVTLGHEPTPISEQVISDVWFPPRGALSFLDDKKFYWLKNRRFDRVCRRQLRPEHRVVHLWNSQATQSARAAKKTGRKLIIDRASTHIRIQTSILTEAYARYGIDYHPTYQETMDRCLEEYELADLVLTPSPASYRSFTQTGFNMSKVALCPFGVTLERFMPRQTPPDDFRAIFVGQLGVRKGVLTLLEAWDKAKLPGELWLAGGAEPVIGDHLKPWRDRADIRWLGFRGDIADLMRQSSVFVFPSLEEGSALVTYEAMACGLPLIVTAEAGSVARDGLDGVIVKPQDPEALAAALTELAQDKNRAWDMGLAARRRIESFPWTGYGDRVALAHRMLAEGADGRAIDQALMNNRPN